MLRALVVGPAALIMAATSLWPQPVGGGTPGSVPVEPPLAAAVDDDTAADLDGADPGRRLAAIIRLGTRGTPDGLRRIRPFLAAADSALRLAASRALIRAGNEDALGRLTTQATTDAAPARLEALLILREAASLPPPARCAAERALADAEPATRLAAMELLTVHPARDSVPAVAVAVGDGNREVRLAAVRLLGLTPDPRALLPLLERLEAADRAERLSLIDTLAHYRAVHPRLEPGPALLRQLDDVNDDIRAATVEALGRVRWAPAVPALARLATQRGDERLARRAAVALGAIGDDAAVGVLIQLLRRPAPSDEVLAALARAGNLAVNPLAAVLRDGLSSSAIAAAHILGRIGDRAATPALAQAVTGASTGGVAISAASALGTLRDPNGVPSLIAAVAAPRYATAPGVREACLKALAAINDHRAAVVVDAALQDQDARIRAAALDLAATVRVAISPRAWAARLRDQDPVVRLAALQAAARVAPAPPLTAIVVDSAMALAAEASTTSGGVDQKISDAVESLVTDADRAGLLDRLPRARTAGERRLVLRAIAALPAPMAALPQEVEPLLLDAVSTGGSQGQGAAEVLAGSRLRPPVLRALLALARAAEPQVRARLCPALAHAGAADADAVLIQLLGRDPDAGVRAAAAWAARTRHAEPAVSRALDSAKDHDAEPAVRANAAAASSASAAPPAPPTNRVRVRLVSPDGAPLAGRWVRVSGGGEAAWALTDLSGEAIFTELRRGPYRLSTAAATDQLALTDATASGRSPATTPVGP